MQGRLRRHRAPEVSTCHGAPDSQHQIATVKRHAFWCGMATIAGSPEADLTTPAVHDGSFRRVGDIRHEYISFLFPALANNIDLLRRYGEWSRCWVVGGIGATIDLTGINDCFGRWCLVGANLASRYFRVVSNVAGA
jgi:hypothetical protein